jgi:hypothetical protein
MNKSDSIKNIAAALVKSQSEMGNAVKDSKNPFFKSNYADLNSIREASLPILNKNGITVLQPTTVSEGKAYVETTLLHESGEFLTSITEIISNKANDAQSAGSGISYARRYGLQSFLCIGAEDDDGEKAVGRAPVKNVGPVVVKTNVDNGTSVNVMSDGKAEASKRGGFGLPKKEEVKTVVTTTTDEWS